jgi:hypothetical protein
VMPKHWKDSSNEGWRGVQEWGVGEAVELQKGMDRLARRANSANWPEYAELDCFACHHSLTKPEDSWRQEQGYPGRTPGVPAWNESRYVVFRHVVRKTNPDAAIQLDSDLRHLQSLLGQRNGNAQEIATTASHAASLAGQIAQQLNARAYDQATTLALMRAIAEDADSISAYGQRAAEQAAMSLDSLAVALEQNSSSTSENPSLRQSIQQLFQELDNPSAYNAPRFATQMRKVSAVLSSESRDEKASARR